MSTKPTLPGSGKSSPFSPPRTSAPQSSGSGGLSGRFGAKVNWTLVPALDEIVCFDVSALDAQGLQALDITPASTTDTDPLVDILSVIEKDSAAAEKLKAQLDESWDSYQLHGALLVYLWREDLREGMAARLNALKRPAIYMRASDPLLILNVLVRARTSLLLANAPLALERTFLERVVASDDPRLIALVRSSGFTEERLTPEELDFSEELE